MNSQINQLNIQQNTLSHINKEKLLNLSKSEKYRYLDTIKINYPKMNSILALIEECHHSLEFARKPKCLNVIGPSGSGKTTLMELHKTKYPDITAQEYTHRTVLYSRIPCPARIGNLPSKMLYDLGDPFYYKKEKISTQTQRLYDLIKACNVKIIFLDEVQHLVDRNSEKLIRDSSDWFKELIDATTVPIIFLGMPDSRKIFIENKQLANRVQLYDELDNFEYDDTFHKVLYLFDNSLPLREYSHLANPDTSKRIYIATKGLMKHIRDLIIESTILTIQNNQDKITMPVLAETFNKVLFFNNGENPFLPGFEI